MTNTNTCIYSTYIKTNKIPHPHTDIGGLGRQAGNIRPAPLFGYMRDVCYSIFNYVRYVQAFVFYLV